MTTPETIPIPPEPPVGSKLADHYGDVWTRYPEGWRGIERAENAPHIALTWENVQVYAPLREPHPGDFDRNPAPPKPSPYPVDVEAETVGDYAVTVDVLDDVLDQLLTAFVSQPARIILTSAALRAADRGDADDHAVKLRAIAREQLAELGVGTLAMDPADAHALAAALTRAADEGPDRCDLPLSTGERCDGFAGVCSRHGDAEVER